jgi:hypothetical protein
LLLLLVVLVVVLVLVLVVVVVLVGAAIVIMPFTVANACILFKISCLTRTKRRMAVWPRERMDKYQSNGNTEPDVSVSRITITSHHITSNE